MISVTRAVGLRRPSVRMRSVTASVLEKFPPSTRAAVRGGVQPYAIDPAHAQALWAKSEEMVGERF